MKGYRTILVGTDGSITAGRAVDRAAQLAGLTGARLLVAYVGEADLGQDVVDAARRRHPEVDVDERLLTGDPADALLGLADAEDVGLVVVGNRGMSGAQRFLLGSVPNRVSHRASCDVLIVHTERRSEN